MESVQIADDVFAQVNIHYAENPLRITKVELLYLENNSGDELPDSKWAENKLAQIIDDAYLANLR
jgi:hypothetical protein